MTIPELGTVKAAAPPIVVLTSNRTREVHDALKRRCLYHWVEYPDFERELAILQARAPEAPAALSREVVAFVQRLRGEDLFKKPGVAETIDWAKCLVALDAVALSPQVIADTLGALLKYQDDIVRLQGTEATRILDAGAGRARAGLTRVAGGRSPAAGKLAREYRAFLPGAPQGRGAGRAGAGGGCGARGRGGGVRRPGRFLLHAAGLLRCAARASGGFRTGFRLFWRDPQFLEQMMSLLSPMVRGVQTPHAPMRRSGARRRRCSTGPSGRRRREAEEGEEV